MTRLHRRSAIQFGLSALLLSTSDVSNAQGDTEEADFDKVISKYKGPEFAALGSQDQIVVPPTLRYRFKFSVSGKIRPLSERRKAAIILWAKANRAPDFAEIFTDEVELRWGNTSLWLPWQRPLKEHFINELSGGGEMVVRVLFIGAIQGELLFLALGYQQL